MSLKPTAVLIALFAMFVVSSQNQPLSSLTIPEDLKRNANAVVRLSSLDVLLRSSNDMVISKKRIITVLNKEGDKAVDAYAHYDNNIKIKTLEARVYNAFGKEIDKIKKGDFKDVSAVSGGTLYSDSRVKYLEYTPISYPYTMVFTCETATSNTAFIPAFTPVTDYFVGVEKSMYSISFPETMHIRKKEANIKNIDVKKDSLKGKLLFQINNLNAFMPEGYSFSISEFTPRIQFASKQFTLEGVDTEVDNWDDFATWMYHDLIKETHDLSESTIAEVNKLVKDTRNDIDKAKKIYQYVQDKVRYISVQVGIGGWQPFPASKVDKLSYGDCKALTNYTMALLKAVGVKSNYSVVYAGNSQRNIDKDFTCMQGNHVILNIPQKDKEDIWLECTSQKLPFGFIGDFTDDRDVLVITPEGGKIKHTKKYTTQENTQITKGSYTVSNNGTIAVNATINSKGIQYDNKYWLETETQRNLDMHYKKRWHYINNMHVNSMDIVNNKDSIVFKETISFEAKNYPKTVANRMLLTANLLNRNTHVPKKYRNRKQPLLIKRGFKDVDEVEIQLPANFTVEAMPKGITLQNKFGKYHYEITKKDDGNLIYKREFTINDGVFPKEDYNTFREFHKTVSKHDNAKIALIKT